MRVQSPTEVKKIPGVVGPDSQYSGHVLKILSENLIGAACPIMWFARAHS